MTGDARENHGAAARGVAQGCARIGAGVAHGGTAGALAYAGAPLWSIVVIAVLGIICSTFARGVAHFPAWSAQARPEIELWIAFIDRRRRSRESVDERRAA